MKKLILSLLSASILFSGVAAKANEMGQKFYFNGSILQEEYGVDGSTSLIYISIAPHLQGVVEERSSLLYIYEEDREERTFKARITSYTPNCEESVHVDEVTGYGTNRSYVVENAPGYNPETCEAAAPEDLEFLAIPE